MAPSRSPNAAVPITQSSAWWRAALIVPPAFLLAVLVHIAILQRFPNSGDEYAYLWQATAFAEGRVTAVSPEPHEAFRLNHVGDENGRRFCKYPPGWPLLLAAGVRLGLPGIVNPLLAALALAGIYRLGCSWISPGAAAAGVALIGTSPFFLLNAGSYYSHPACLFALTVMALALAWAGERPGGWAAALGGAAWGLAVLVRPFSACLVGAPFVLNFLWRSRFRDAILFGLGGLPMAAVLAFVNAHVTGSWTTLAWSQFDPTERLGFGVYGHTPARGVRIAVKLLAEGLVTTGLVAPLLALRTWAHAETPRRTLLWCASVAIVAGHLFWWSDGGNRYGPRFYFEALLPFTLLVGAGFESIAGKPRLRRITVLSALCTGAAITAIVDANAYRQIAARRDVYRVSERARLEHAIVFLETASADMVRIDLTRNPPEFEQATVLYALSNGVKDSAVRERFRSRTAYWYRWTPEGGTLQRTPFD